MRCEFTRFPSNRMELERICQEEQDKLPNSRCAKLVETTAKGVSAKYYIKGVIKFVNEKIVVLIFNIKKFANNSENMFSLFRSGSLSID